MSEHRAEHRITTMCRLLGVSTSGYYAWEQREPSARAQANERLLARMRTIHVKSRETYGAPRMIEELQAEGMRVGHNRVSRLMRQAGLVGASRRKGCWTTCRNKDARPAPDLVERKFVADAPDKLWVADITYVPTWTGFLFLAVVLDVFSRRIVGWAMANHLRTELILEALDMAIFRRRPQYVIHHSDQGCQYTSLEFGKRCREAGVRPSMGSVGDCFDNSDVRIVLRYAGVRTPGAASIPHPGAGGADRVRVHRGLVQHAASALVDRLLVADGLRKAVRAGSAGVGARKRLPGMPPERASCSGMSPKSGAGEAKQRPARSTINRSPHPSTESGELQRKLVRREGIEPSTY